MRPTEHLKSSNPSRANQSFPAKDYGGVPPSDPFEQGTPGLFEPPEYGNHLQSYKYALQTLLEVGICLEGEAVHVGGANGEGVDVSLVETLDVVKEDLPSPPPG